MLRDPLVGYPPCSVSVIDCSSFSSSSVIDRFRAATLGLAIFAAVVVDGLPTLHAWRRDEGQLEDWQRAPGDGNYCGALQTTPFPFPPFVLFETLGWNQFNRVSNAQEADQDQYLEGIICTQKARH